MIRWQRDRGYLLLWSTETAVAFYVLKSQRTGGCVPGHRGFTIIEMVVATFLVALLALLLAAAVATFARPAAEVDGRTRLALEASLAAEALARDLGGYLVDTSSAPGNLQQYPFSSWSLSSDGSILFLNFQGAPRTSLPDRDVPAAGCQAGSNPFEQRFGDGGGTACHGLPRTAGRSNDPDAGSTQISLR